MMKNPMANQTRRTNKIVRTNQMLTMQRKKSFSRKKNFFKKEMPRKVATMMNRPLVKNHGESNVTANGDCMLTETQGPLKGQ